MSGGIELVVNGRAVRLEVDGRKPLLAVLRDDLALRGSRFGCGTEQCGACMVLIDGEPAYSCSREIETLAGHAVTTIEGLAGDGRLHPLQQAFLDEQAGQCGYCLSGIMISARGALEDQPGAEPGRGRGGARQASVPLRRAQPRHPRGAEGGRAHGGSRRMIANTLPQGIIDNPLLSQWIGFEEAGRVRFSSGKVEIGQGAVTALAQIAAEELDVAVAQLRVISGETWISPTEKFTTGSDTIVQSGAAVRLVCAEVRALLVKRAAERLGCDATELAVEDGRILRGGKDCGLDYWALAREVDLARPATGGAPTKLPSQYRIVGRNVPRLDLPAKICGRLVRARHHARQRAACAHPAPALARRPARRARRGGGAPRRQ